MHCPPSVRLSVPCGFVTQQRKGWMSCRPLGRVFSCCITVYSTCSIPDKVVILRGPSPVGLQDYCNKPSITGGAENAGLKNAGSENAGLIVMGGKCTSCRTLKCRTKCRRWNMQDLNMRDQLSGVEKAGADI